MARNSKTYLDLIRRRPTAFVLLSLIAYRAKRTNDSPFDDLKVGQAYVGDYENYGVTEQIYRSDKKFLEKHKISTFKSTNKGTIATLCNDNIFDINPTTKLTTKLTGSQRPANDQLTTNKNDKNDKNEKKDIDTYISEFNKFFSTSFQVTEGRDKKLGLRLKSFSMTDVLLALENLSRSKFHKGQNDRGWKADPDFLIRSDEQVDRWLNTGEKTRTTPVTDPNDPLLIAAIKRAEREGK